jgi:hypothetical protein
VRESSAGRRRRRPQVVRWWTSHFERTYRSSEARCHLGIRRPSLAGHQGKPQNHARLTRLRPKADKNVLFVYVSASGGRNHQPTADCCVACSDPRRSLSRFFVSRGLITSIQKVTSRSEHHSSRHTASHARFRVVFLRRFSGRDGPLCRPIPPKRRVASTRPSGFQKTKNRATRWCAIF